MPRGIFRIYRDGIKVAEQQNLITDQGHTAFLRYLAGEIPDWGGAIAVGAGSNIAFGSNTRLDFEIGRSETTLSVADINNFSVIKKCTLSNNVAGRITEMGVYTAIMNTSTDNTNRLLTTFDPEREPWQGGSVITGRVGEHSLSLNSSQTVLNEFRTDLSVYQSNDIFSLAMENNNTNQVEVRMETDSANYYRMIMSAVGNSFTIYKWYKSQFIAVGNPSWSNLNNVRIITTGGSTVLEGFRIDDTDPYENYVMVSRMVLDSPEIKEVDEEMEIEYEIEFGSVV